MPQIAIFKPGQGVDTFTTGTATGTAATALAANNKRRYLLIQNNSTSETLYIRTDGTTATTGNGIAVGAGQAYERKIAVPTGAISLIASGSCAYVIVEM